MEIVELNKTLEYWIAQLDGYTLTEIQTKPDSQSFSLGQLYLHLIADTEFYLEQINACITLSADVIGDMTPMAKEMFQNNSFPDAKLKGDPANDKLPQPKSIEELRASLVS